MPSRGEKHPNKIRRGLPMCIPTSSLSIFIILLAVRPTRAWLSPSSPSIRISSNYRRSRQTAQILFPSFLSTASSASATSNSNTTDVEFKPSFYKTKEKERSGRRIWLPRKQLSELKVGDPLQGYVVQEHLKGETGPKIYLECGVGRYNSQTQTWKLANGMLRLGHKGTKMSVTQKRVARLKKRTSIDCYVSRIRLDNGHLEVVLNPEEVPSESKQLISASSLKPGQELIGTVDEIVSYGVFVDVGANRRGLLHIQSVADFFGNYIDKEKGLKESGLEKGAKIKVQVATNEKKRLALDFTEEAKQDAAQERIERQKRKEERQRKKAEAISGGGGSETAATTTSTTPSQAVAGDTAVTSTGAVVSSVSGATDDDSQASEEEEDPWASYAAMYQDEGGNEDDNKVPEKRDDEDDDYDEYDEDRDIEDALGLGTY